jgi:23S rRNA pseudouridine955/2504/2580 synthase
MPQTPHDTSSDHESPAGIPSPRRILIDAAHHGQRLDNFLIATIKNVPRSRLYRAIRSGEVRINGGRARPSSRLASGDQVRLPPLGSPAREHLVLERHALGLEERILYEDADLLIIDKPSGIPVHGGSGHSHGLIEQLMILRPGAQLVHRLDRPTSGCLLIAKHRPALLLLHGLLKQRLLKKHYLALAAGHWPGSLTTMDAPIARTSRLPGESASQRDALTHFQVMERFEHYTLLQATPVTGRMHQIRLHAAAAGHPIAGDALYGSAPWNQAMRHLGLGRLFLHARRLEIPWQDSTLAIEAPWPAALLTVLEHLRESPRQSGAE